MIQRVGLLHPGAMGSSLGAALAEGVAGRWASEGRSAESATRAREAGLADVETVSGLAGACELLISVCPPDAALAQARAVAATGFAGIYLDANAVAPETARAIAGCFDGLATRLVDGGLIGPPARQAGTTRLYLSGEAAHEVPACFAGGPLDARVLDGPVGAASALKMAYAGWTKGSAALLAAIHAYAGAEGVDAALFDEWAISQPDLAGRVQHGVPATAPKAWRFAGEMDEIAASLAAAGLPDGFHRAAREIYARLAGFKGAAPPPLAEIASRLRAPGAPSQEDADD